MRVDEMKHTINGVEFVRYHLQCYKCPIIIGTPIIVAAIGSYKNKEHKLQDEMS